MPYSNLYPRSSTHSTSRTFPTGHQELNFDFDTSSTAEEREEDDAEGEAAELATVAAPGLDGLINESPSNELSAVALLKAMWPATGLHYQIGHLDRRSRQFRNQPVLDVADAMARATRLSDSGCDVYFACAAFKSAADRTSANVSSAQGFWFDIDCGADKESKGTGYATIDRARESFAAFLGLTCLPRPTHVVRSGGGLQKFWALTKPVLAEDWVIHARKLKAVAAACGLLADPARSADIASVMRMPGTWNHKYVPARLVVLEVAHDAIDTTAMLRAVDEAHARLCPSSLPATPNGSQAASGIVCRDVEASAFPSKPDLQRLTSALKVLDPDCDEATWKLHRLAPLADEARQHPELASNIYAIAESWSSGELAGKPSLQWLTKGPTSGLTGKMAFAKEWSRFFKGGYGGTPATLGTIYQAATDEGWRPFAEASPLDGYAQDISVVNAAIKAAVADVGAPLEPPCIAALARIKALNPAEYSRLRLRIKNANKSVSVSGIDSAVTGLSAPEEIKFTHHSYASNLVRSLAVGVYQPVAHEGYLHVVDPHRSIWVPRSQPDLERLVAEKHDGKENCVRRSDYQGIALHAVSLVSDQAYFAAGPVGIACTDGFYRVTATGYTREALSPGHRQRVLIDIVPCAQPMPRFLAFLEQTFKSDQDGEAAQQIALVQEIAGAIMLGIMPRHQKAVLFYDPYGRAGKGTLESILRRLVPNEFVTAVSPFSWDKEYFVATLAGARLNVVGELPETESIPAAIFKSVLGGDPITGRPPFQKPITFKNSAAHIFMSNHMINTRDQTEAFFARWLIVEFPNSLLRSGLPLDPALAEDIATAEMPGIAHWALQGATRLLSNGKFSASVAHDRLMSKWRRGSSSLHEFIDDACDLDAKHWVRRSQLYTRYESWCKANGRKPFAKARVKELLEFNVTLHIRLACLDGHEIFRGIKLREAPEDYEL